MPALLGVFTVQLTSGEYSGSNYYVAFKEPAYSLLAGFAAKD